MMKLSCKISSRENRCPESLMNIGSQGHGFDMGFKTRNLCLFFCAKPMPSLPSLRHSGAGCADLLVRQMFGMMRAC